MESFVECSNVYVKKGKYGYGVFAKKDFKAGEVIERGIMCRLVNVDGNENPHLFTWSDDRKIWASGSGCLAFYNHSDTPNIVKKGDLINDTMTIVALIDIKKDDELCNTYFSKKWRTCFQDF
jgi:SET domain-containing protein